jgi:Leucine-rich repeat (LRR) protein
MKRVFLANFCFFCLTICVHAEQTGSRIVHFPEDRACGRLMLRSFDPNQRSKFLYGWELLGQAQGDVTIPAGKQLRLEVYQDATDISFLSELKPNDLESLSLGHTDIVDEDFVHLKDLAGLQELDLSSMKQIYGSGLAHLANFKSLKKLTCFNANITDSALEHISKIDSIEDLSLYMTGIDGSGLIHIKNLTSLKSLSLSKTSVTNASLVHLKDMTWLRELELYDVKIGDSGLVYLKGLRSLEKLILGSIDRNSDVSPITNAGLVHLSTLTKLKNLGLYRTCITDDGLKHLSSLKNLETLSLNRTKITGAGFVYLNKHAPLRSLGLDETALTESGLANLKPWSSTVENLDMEGVQLNDADLVLLADFKALKYINLGDTQITDAGIVHIRNIRSLESLYCRNTKITDEGLMELKDLPNLQQIDVRGTLVTNKGLESFEQASANESIESNVSYRLVSFKGKGLQRVKVETPQPEARPLPLIGKLLPNLDKIKIGMDSEQAKGKLMLVCFFDMEQRPSRNCIMQLNKKAKELKEKDIVIVAVQASKVEQSKLDEWIKEHEITFPVGMIEADQEKTRLAWGVKSLPWLILTDKEHIVTAEGFSIDELDEKIKGTEKIKH